MSESIRTVVQCAGHTKSGRRCKRRTAKTPLCFSHLESEKHLMVKPSHIRAAGLGLYTTIPRHRRQVISDYIGTPVINHDPDYGGEYVFQLKKHTFTNADKTTSTPGRYANDAQPYRQPSGFQNNSKFSVSSRYHTANIVAARNIPLATKQHPKEIFVPYGKDYWVSKRRQEAPHMIADE